MGTMKCLLCGEEATLKTARQKGYQEPDLFSIYHCRHCNTSFSTPRTNAGNIYELIYKHAQDIGSYNDYCRYYNEIGKQKFPLLYLASASLTYWSVAYALKKMAKAGKKSKILEVGSGLGYFTYALRKAGYDATGIDISNEAVEKANARYGPFYRCGDIGGGAVSEKYDIVVLTEVIEHINEPVVFIKNILKNVNGGGKLIVTTPNKSFFPEDAVWETDSPPVHCWWFSEESMRYIAKRLDLSIEFLDYRKSWQARMSQGKKAAKAEGGWIFAANGEVKEPCGAAKPRFGIFPQWVKNSDFYRIASNCIYPAVSKLYPPNRRSAGLCAVLKKR